MLVPIVSILQSLLSLYVLALLGRVVLDWIQVFSRQWRPRGLVLLMANLVYALTDPPLRWLGRVVPVLRTGGMGIDLSFIALYLIIVALQVLLGMMVRI